MQTLLCHSPVGNAPPGLRLPPGPPPASHEPGWRGLGVTKQHFPVLAALTCAGLCLVVAKQYKIHTRLPCVFDGMNQNGNKSSSGVISILPTLMRSSHCPMSKINATTTQNSTVSLALSVGSLSCSLWSIVKIPLGKCLGRH